ncbi:class II glutamine amidotransferase [Thermoanaerobaculum aquaticum]|uniref:class II glutamine amidotransferase n=1 Tax=Thermoanaerobaculum aquaticum TaxID=1312852 RepID=UPI0009DEF051|nr:class II glutamine amidotransferase [Thermoanaerobaculum aquaticum]
MCRLLGLVANKPVDLSFSLGKFGDHAAKNPDGWGIAWWTHFKGWEIRKEPYRADTSEHYKHVSVEAKGQVFVCHVRFATIGEKKMENTHPFRHGDWVFAHNGSLDREKLLGLLRKSYRQCLRGETDSETFFLWILQNIEGCDHTLNGIRSAIRGVQDLTLSSLNFLLANGPELYVFRHATQKPNYYTLFYLVRDGTMTSPLQASSHELPALLKSKRLAGERAVLVCSEQLTDETWTPVEQGTLLVIDGANLSVKSYPVL